MKHFKKFKNAIKGRLGGSVVKPLPSAQVRSQGPGIESRIGLSAQQGACFLLSPSLPASLPTCDLSLSNK